MPTGKNLLLVILAGVMACAFLKGMDDEFDKQDKERVITWQHTAQ